MKNIVFVLDSMRIGGAERVAFQIICSLSTKHFVSIVLIGEQKVEFDLPKKIRTIFIGPVKRPKIKNKIIKLHKVFLDLKPDLIISFLNAPIIYTYFSAKGINVPLLFSERNNPKRSPSNIIIRLLRNYCFRGADCCIFQTNDAMKYFARRGVKKSFVIPNPVDFIPDGYLESTSRSNEIICVARLNKQKNIFQLIKAFYYFSKKYQSFILKIYGCGPLLNRLKKYRYAIYLGDRVRFMGVQQDWVNRESNARMFVLPSIYEGFPNSLAEACAACIPAVATDCDIGGSRDILSHFKSSSILIKKHDYLTIMNAMDTLVENNIYNVKMNEYLDFYSYCNKEKVIKQWEDIIDEICV